jgi:hypothetical protein
LEREEGMERVERVKQVYAYPWWRDSSKNTTVLLQYQVKHPPWTRMEREREVREGEEGRTGSQECTPVLLQYLIGISFLGHARVDAG